MRQRVRINEQIWAREVRLIDEEGKQVGVIPKEKALEIARSKGLDLVEVNSNSDPIVCRIVNYDKYRFFLEKREKEQRLSSKKIELKEVRLGVRTGEHDLEFKRANVIKFLKKGKKVKVELVLKGRERAHKELGRTILVEFLEKIKEETNLKVEQPIMNSPRGFNFVISR